MKFMKLAIIALFALILGITGLLFILGETESIIKLILSKPIGIILLIASYKLYNKLKEIINNITFTY